MCGADTGNWFGDCFSCQPGFFRQPDVASCLDFCPTMSIPNLLTHECSELGLDLGPISSVVFNMIGPLYKGFPFGLYRLMAGFDFNATRPINTITRGLFFDGGSGYVNLSGIVLNSKFSAHFWAYFITFQGDLFSVEVETPSTANEEQIMTTTCG